MTNLIWSLTKKTVWSKFFGQPQIFIGGNKSNFENHFNRYYDYVINSVHIVFFVWNDIKFENIIDNINIFLKIIVHIFSKLFI